MTPRLRSSVSRFLRPTWRGAGKDLCAVLVLILVSVGLGLFARSGCKSASSSSSGVLRPSELTHPVFSVTEFRAYVEERRGLILDARNEDEYKEGHLPGALSLSVADFDKRYEDLKPKLDPQKANVLVVYCSSMWCGLADELQKKLIDRGFEHVGTFPDGWAAWQEAKLPVEKLP